MAIDMVKDDRRAIVADVFSDAASLYPSTSQVLVWTTSDSTVVLFQQGNGTTARLTASSTTQIVIVAVKAGTATVTATRGASSGTLTVTVVAEPAVITVRAP